MLLEVIKSITLGDIALTLAFVAGVIGSIAAIKKVYAGHKTKERERERTVMQEIVEEAVKKHVEPLESELAATKKEVKVLRSELGSNNVQTARVDLMMGIEHTPHEHEAILKLATNYFLNLGGDAWMSGALRKWATEEGVDISYIAERVPHLKG